MYQWLDNVSLAGGVLASLSLQVTTDADLPRRVQRTYTSAENIYEG